jgi:protein-disulfide isomerase
MTILKVSKADGHARLAARRRTVGGALLLGCLVLSAGLIGCSDQKAAAASSPPSRGASADATMPEVLATVGDEQITMADVRARVGDDLDQNETRYRVQQHKLVENALQEILRERVLGAEAKKQGKTVDQLMEAEVGGTLEPTEVEIATWYKENRARTGGRTLEQVRPQVADFLRDERRREAAEKLEARLNKERNIKINLEPYRVTLNNEGAPAMGPANAAVTLVEFSDFQCPFCGRFAPTLKQIEQNFGDRVRIVYRQYPIPNLHPNAMKAAEASLCANDQGKFWEMHDLMFQEQKQLAVRELKAKAGRLGLDQKKFDSCLDSGRYTEQVQEDMKAGSRVGVTGTPALFVNGVRVEGGAVPYETVAKAIEKELARAAR